MEKIKRMRTYNILTLLLILCFSKNFAQNKDDNFYKEIKNYDIAEILTTENIITENNETLKKAEPIGFIGNDYQRFYIHFISVIKNKDNPYEYLVQGKTKVKETIRPFLGTLTIKNATIGKDDDFPEYPLGFATCEVNFYEDKKMTSTGSFKGTMTIGYVKKNNQLIYDAVAFYTDGFSNNEFKGKWTSYKTGLSKKCNWGDYRIPESGDLDIGSGEFSPNSKYFDKGWKYYILSMYGETELDVDLGKKKEKIKWWK